jgi:hypothetical protein
MSRQDQAECRVQIQLKEEILVKLEISDKAAQALAELLTHVAGHPDTTARGHLLYVTEQLKIRGFDWNPRLPLRAQGEVMFNEIDRERDRTGKSYSVSAE